MAQQEKEKVQQLKQSLKSSSIRAEERTMMQSPVGKETAMREVVETLKQQKQ